MAGPWEDYAAAPAKPAAVASAGPWAEYAAPKVSRGAAAAPDLSIPGNPAPPVPGQIPPPPQSPDLMDRMKGGAEANLSLVSAIPAGVAGGAAGLWRGLTGGKYGTAEGGREASARASEVAGKLTYAPRTETGQDILSTAGKWMDESKLAGLNPAQGMTAASIARPSAAAAAQAGGRAAAKGAAAITPKVEPQVAQLAQRASEMGIKIPPDMLTDNKFLRLLGQASRDVPLSGSGVAENRGAFNQAIIKAFGGDPTATKISPQVYAKAMNEHGSTIGNISAKNPIPFDPQFVKKLDEMAFNSANFETADVAKVIKSYTDEIRGLGQAKGVIDGEAFRKLRTKLTGQMRRTSDGDLKHALSELDDHMLDAVQAQLSPQELQAFNQARQFYANGKTVEPLIAKAASKGSGDMSPAALAARVTGSSSGKSAVAKGRGGDLADISAVGNRFLTEPGSSMTAERGLTYGAMGGGGFVNPLIPASIYGAANLYNRLGPRLARGMIPTPP